MAGKIDHLSTRKDGISIRGGDVKTSLSVRQVVCQKDDLWGIRMWKTSFSVHRVHNFCCKSSNCPRLPTGIRNLMEKLMDLLELALILMGLIAITEHLFASYQHIIRFTTFQRGIQCQWRKRKTNRHLYIFKQRQIHLFQ